MTDPLGVWVNVRFSHDAHDRLAILAKYIGTTRSAIVREALAQYLARLGPEITCPECEELVPPDAYKNWSGSGPAYKCDEHMRVGPAR